MKELIDELEYARINGPAFKNISFTVHESDIDDLMECLVFMRKFRYRLHTRLKKKTDSEWEGHVVGFYSTTLTAEGYAIESKEHKGSVQIYPVSALEVVK